MNTTIQLTEETVLNALRQVIDPELGCNLVDLGLIYDVKIRPGTEIESTKVDVKMTLTSPGCPMQGSLASGVHAALLAIEGVEEATVDLVFDPPWTAQMLSEAGRAILGIYES